jgi:hypothetical protein
VSHLPILAPPRPGSAAPHPLSVSPATLRPGPPFAVTLAHGPKWDGGRAIREQDLWDEHAAIMDGLVDDGFIIIGGPLGDGSRSLHAVDAPDEDIRARLAAETWASAQLLLIGSVEPWAWWLGGRAARGTARHDASAVRLARAATSGHRA